MPEIKERSGIKDADVRVLVAIPWIWTGWLKENMQRERERQQGQKSSAHGILRWLDREEQVLLVCRHGQRNCWRPS